MSIHLKNFQIENHNYLSIRTILQVVNSQLTFIVLSNALISTNKTQMYVYLFLICYVRPTHFFIHDFLYQISQGTVGVPVTLLKLHYYLYLEAKMSKRYFKAV